MATPPVDQTLSSEAVAPLKYILGKLFDDGQRWVTTIGPADWRRARYVGVRARRSTGAGPSTANLVESIQPLLAYLAKSASDETAEAHSYVIVKPDSGCLKEDGIVLFRPVLKCNKNSEPQLNFHIWFHCMPSANHADHLMAGWRLEGPEGRETTHDFFHAQPLRIFQGNVHGLPQRFPERFPTIPLPASNVVELCLTAVLVACGKEALRAFVIDRRNEDTHAAAKILWGKLFGTTAHSAASQVLAST